MNIEIIEVNRDQGLTIAYFKYSYDGREFESNINLKDVDGSLTDDDVMIAIRQRLEEL